DRDVTRATRDLVGRSLVSIDADEVEGSLRSLPAVAGVSVDRAFPGTLVIRIAPERSVAVIRRGTSAWLPTGVRLARTRTRQGDPRDRRRDRARDATPLDPPWRHDPGRRPDSGGPHSCDTR